MQFLHFDPITLGVVIVAIIGGYVTTKNNTSWHSEWIEKHDKECREYKNRQNDILTAVQVSMAQLTQIESSTVHRVERIENILDKKE